MPALKHEPYFKVIENCYHHLDMLFTGLSTFQSFQANQFLKENYGPELFKDIPDCDVAGMIMGRPYNIKGEFFPDFEQHICGISRFGVVRKCFKSAALLGALRSGIITHLVTNDAIAQRVLQNID